MFMFKANLVLNDSVSRNLIQMHSFRRILSELFRMYFDRENNVLPCNRLHTSVLRLPT